MLEVSDSLPRLKLTEKSPSVMSAIRLRPEKKSLVASGRRMNLAFRAIHSPMRKATSRLEERPSKKSVDHT